MNKNLLYSLLAFCTILTGCNSDGTSDVSSSASESSVSEVLSSEDSLSNTVESTVTESSSEEQVEAEYVTIDDVNTLFTTYEDETTYDFIANYRCDVISDRHYLGGWETEYMYDGYNLSLGYSDGTYFYTDYYIYNEETQQMIYYVDNGDGSYQFLTQESDYFFDYASYIDHFELANIEWELDMVFDLNNKVCIPANDRAKDTIGRTIFGDNNNEYWHDLKIYWNNGYISKVEAVSIYQESTYYYTVDLSLHGYVNGSIVPPKDAVEFVDPYTPFMKGKEDYEGTALTQDQIDAITMFNSEKEMNYTVDVTWQLVVNSQVQDLGSEFFLKAENGNYEYSYADTTYPDLFYYFYLLSGSDNSYPICFVDPDMDGTYSLLSSGMSEYDTYVSNIYLDRVLLHSIDSSDLIYDEKGYITAKDAATEEQLCVDLFYFADGYGGLQIYLAEDEQGNLVLDKIVTSMVSSDDSGNVYSFVKTYKFSNINSTTIKYPEGVSI